MQHPAHALFEADASTPQITLAACDHYAGTPQQMQKALLLQQQLGPIFDITFDCEDGAQVGNERQHAITVANLINSTENRFNRVGVRVHDPNHPAFIDDLTILIGQAGARIAYITLPKAHNADEVRSALTQINQISDNKNISRIPVDTLIETTGALHEVFEIAAIEQVICLSFGLMDFVSHYQGTIPVTAMEPVKQFEHPIIAHAMLQIALACHTYGKIAAHNVCTDIIHSDIVKADTLKAYHQFGYKRKWSIHPNQIQPILQAFTPSFDEVNDAIKILLNAQAVAWGPIQYAGKLHDRASYRYYWLMLQQAQRHIQLLPQEIRNQLIETSFFREHKND